MTVQTKTTSRCPRCGYVFEQTIRGAFKKRNRDIFYKVICAGWRLKDVALEYGISTSRVSGIAKKEARRRGHSEDESIFDMRRRYL